MLVAGWMTVSNAPCGLFLIVTLSAARANDAGGLRLRQALATRRADSADELVWARTEGEHLSPADSPVRYNRFPEGDVRRSACCVAGRSTINHRTYGPPTVTGISLPTATTMLVCVRRAPCGQQHGWPSQNPQARIPPAGCPAECASAKSRSSSRVGLSQRSVRPNKQPARQVW